MHSLNVDVFVIRLCVAVDPVIKFEANPTPEQVAEGSSGAIPTTSGVVILLESDVNNKETGKTSREAKKRKAEPDVQVLPDGPSVRFPEYLNQPAPNDLSMIELRRHVMIAQINHYNASTRFYDKAASVIPHIKRFIAEMPSLKQSGSERNDHGYAFAKNSNNSESDCDVRFSIFCLGFHAFA